MKEQTLKGKVVLVTGAGSGLGEATAQAFAEAGSSVACVDLNAAAVERVSQKLNGLDTPSIAFPCNVSDADAVFSVVQAVSSKLGRLDIVVNCAAIDHTVSVDEMTVEQWDQVIAVNLRGPFLFAKAALPYMRRQHGGQIINVASTAAVRAWANASAYHASKWGLIGFSRGLGVEGRPDGIRVTTIIPGGMQTHFFDRFAEQGIPMPETKNLQDPANVAATIVFAAQVPPESALQELMITPLTETSWP
ncbi:SDR family oxidoreductase [Ktedonosporobacter rubrisoli]|uniref:SDR family oxidoreductase n=1 Tax=Ktedonosporobacter rubrisoli TaxID=2509675 RepID=A0A4P6JS46_KTERU|nr:SDR family oxidoreductase [Ktedonosporobacter rubrisoli]QBD78338.1 SDR family oxidoreductase [Ktedonosporobacter rubrisoli]